MLDTNTPHCDVLMMLRVKEQILREPERLDMKFFENICGTTRCIAGWALHLDGQSVRGVDGVIATRAAEVLGLNQKVALDLFCIVSSTPSGATRATATQAARAIDNVIATGWPKWDEVLA